MPSSVITISCRRYRSPMAFLNVFFETLKVACMSSAGEWSPSGHLPSFS